MNAILKFTVLSLLLTSISYSAQDDIESETPVFNRDELYIPKDNKTNIIGKSKIEIIAHGATRGAMVTFNYIINPQLLVGVSSQNEGVARDEKGGDLDAGQYYMTSYGYSGSAALVGAKYFLKDYGIPAHGLFLASQLGRRWGRYTFSQERYSRENGFLNQLFGDDKKLMESSSDQASTSGNILRALVGYTAPFVDGILLKGVALQLQAGFEANDLPESKYLTTKFSQKDVGAEFKTSVYVDFSVAAYF